jgi:hypothetical protein
MNSPSSYTKSKDQETITPAKPVKLWNDDETYMKKAQIP